MAQTTDAASLVHLRPHCNSAPGVTACGYAGIYCGTIPFANATDDVWPTQVSGGDMRCPKCWATWRAGRAESLARFAASIRHFGVTVDEAVTHFRKFSDISLPPHLEAILALAHQGTRPGWWRSPGGWVARWRFGRWRAGLRKHHTNRSNA